MNDEEPQVPQPLPEIPRGRLWASLLVPPLLTVASTAVLVQKTVNDYGIGGLGVLPLGLIAVIVCLFPFLRALRVRYQGRSVTLLGWGFFIGQIVICLTVWYGTCLVVFN